MDRWKEGKKEGICNYLIKMFKTYIKKNMFKTYSVSSIKHFSVFCKNPILLDSQFKYNNLIVSLDMATTCCFANFSENSYKKRKIS